MRSASEPEVLDPIDIGDMVTAWPAPKQRRDVTLPPRPTLLTLGCPTLPPPMPLSHSDAVLTRSFAALVRSYADVIGIPRPRMPAKSARDKALDTLCAETLRFLGDHHISPALWLSWQPRVSFPKLVDPPRARLIYAICRSAWRLPIGQFVINAPSLRAINLWVFLAGEASYGDSSPERLQALERQLAETVETARRENRLVEAQLARDRADNKWVWGKLAVRPTEEKA